MNSKRYYNNIYYSKIPKGNFDSFFTKCFNMLGVKNGSKVLDVACGPGNFCRVASRYGCSVYGVDISDKAISHCKNTLGGSYSVADICEDGLSFADGEFDAVTCFGSVEHFLNIPKALCEMKRVLKCDGKMLVTVPISTFVGNLFWKGTDQKDNIEVIYSLKKWKSVFESCGLKVVLIKKDTQLLSLDWIFNRGVIWSPVKFIAAVLERMLPVWLSYQVIFVMEKI